MTMITIRVWFNIFVANLMIFYASGCCRYRAVGTHCQSGEVHSGDKLESGVDSKENLESEKVLLESDRVTDEKEDSLTSFVNDKVGPFGTHCQSGEAEANTTDTGDSKEKLESEQVALASDKVTEEKEDSLTSYVGKKIGSVMGAIKYWK